MPTSRPVQSRRADRPRLKPTDRVFDGLDLPAFADLQRAVLTAAGILGDCGNPHLSDAALGHPEYRQILGAQQHLADARDLQHQGGMPWTRENSEGSADRRIETSVDVGNLRAVAVLRSAAFYRQARAEMDSAVRLVPDRVEHDRGCPPPLCPSLPATTPPRRSALPA